MNSRNVLLAYLGVLSLMVTAIFSETEAVVRDEARTLVQATRSCPVANSINITGITTLNPQTQQLKIVFAEKTSRSHGAVISLDFISTVTWHGPAITDLGDATNYVHVESIYCHPQLTAQRIMGRVEKQASDMRATTTTIVVNPATPNPSISPTLDFRLTPTVRVEAITRDVYIGFVPVSSSYPTTNGSNGFYDVGWTSNASFPTWVAGILSYQVASDAVFSVEVVSIPSADELRPFDVFETFCDDELDVFLEELQDFFGNSSVAMRTFLAEHPHEFKKVFKALYN